MSYRVNIELARLIGADFNVTTDHAIAILANTYVIRRITVANASVSLTTAAGGFYTAASKGGTAIVAAAQAYAALTGSTLYLDCTLALTGTVLTANPIYFALTAAQGVAATADIYVYGDLIK